MFTNERKDGQKPSISIVVNAVTEVKNNSFIKFPPGGAERNILDLCLFLDSWEMT